MKTLSQAAAFGQTAAQYEQLRAQGLRAITALRYVRDAGGGLTPAQFACETERGHQWSYSGTEYGGDDDSYRGEGRAYCALCGADGDA
jgi:hypothetical protein